MSLGSAIQAGYEMVGGKAIVEKAIKSDEAQHTLAAALGGGVLAEATEWIIDGIDWVVSLFSAATPDGAWMAAIPMVGRATVRWTDHDGSDHVEECLAVTVKTWCQPTEKKHQELLEEYKANPEKDEFYQYATIVIRPSYYDWRSGQHENGFGRLLSFMSGDPKVFGPGNHPELSWQSNRCACRKVPQPKKKYAHDKAWFDIEAVDYGAGAYPLVDNDTPLVFLSDHSHTSPAPRSSWFMAYSSQIHVGDWMISPAVAWPESMTWMEGLYLWDLAALSKTWQTLVARDIKWILEAITGIRTSWIPNLPSAVYKTVINESPEQTVTEEVMDTVAPGAGQVWVMTPGATMPELLTATADNPTYEPTPSTTVPQRSPLPVLTLVGGAAYFLLK